jgi:DNA repair protein RecN (Recombination protein N)
MLTHIHIRNLAIVDEIDLELAPGMTVLTGETGAGKSILIDALGLVLGDRADSNWIRHGEERAEISASFDTGNNRPVQEWLTRHDMDLGDECQLRRILGRDGRSRGYINGQPAPMQLLRELGESLVDIHGQHEHQSLLRPAAQRELLDAFGGYPALVAEVSALYRQWQTLREQLADVLRSERDRDARHELLRFQLGELEAAGLSVEEIASLDAEHARQANAGRLLESSQRVLAWLNSEDTDSAAGLLGRSQDELAELAALDSRLAEPLRQLEEALALTRESVTALRHYAERLDLDPERLQWLEQRIGILHDLARKHRCPPAGLPALTGQLRAELDAIEHAGQLREQFETQLAGVEQAYRAAAQQLSERRRQTADAFGKEVSATMQTLGMPGAGFAAGIQPRTEPGLHGLDSIEYRVSTNRGQPMQPLARVASGGELSRISLSIQVIAADSGGIPTLIFDEVDSGIGGGVAEITGRRLRSLAAARQVLCVTHLPQVAAQAHHQLQVAKQAGAESTHTRIHALSGEDRVDELARMLGGVKITRQTREHAREMLGQSGAEPGSPPPRGPRRKKARA